MINNFFITIKLQVHVYRTYIYGYCIFYDEHLLQKKLYWRKAVPCTKYFWIFFPGIKHVCQDPEVVEKVYKILERRLWDDPTVVSMNCQLKVCQLPKHIKQILCSWLHKPCTLMSVLAENCHWERVFLKFFIYFFWNFNQH